MGDKKGKALALELIDDLLNEKSVEISTIEPGKQKQSASAGTVVHPANGSPLLDPQDDKTIDMSKSEHPPLPQIPSAADDRTVPLKGGGQQATIVSGAGTPDYDAHPTPGHDRVRASVGRPGAFRSVGAPLATEAALAQSESLRIAQGRILELETELERLRLQNEELAAAGETLRHRADELLAENGKRQADYDSAVSTFDQERNLLNQTKEALQRDLELARRKNDELNLRINTDFQKIRVRERELNNRLDLHKAESAALIRAKDEMILGLKRDLDKIELESKNFMTKNQELNRLMTDKQEMLRRTVKALRLALSMLEGEEETPKAGQKKAK